MTNGQLHIISTGKQQVEQLAEIIGMIHPYIDFVHLREKQKTAKEIYGMVKLLKDKKVPLSKIMINDRSDVAVVSMARGVHLAYHSLPPEKVKQHFPNLAVGVSVHSVEEANAADQWGADYMLFGHVYPTRSKPGLAPKGLGALRTVSKTAIVPVVAIGGITPENAKQIMEAGAAGIAVMSGVLEAEDPIEAVRQYRAAISG